MTRKICLFAAIFLYFIIGVNSYVEKFSVRNINDEFLLLQSFGFLKGGYIDINHINIDTTPTNDSLWFLMCTQAEFKGHFRKAVDFPTCESIAEEFCEISVNFTGSLTGRYEIEKGAFYYLIFAQCGPGYYNADLDYVLMNPGGEHLSTDSIPFPVLYMILLASWFLLSAAWCFNWITNRRQKIKLHRAISLFPFVKFLFCCAAVYYWKSLSSNGIETSAMVGVYQTFNVLFEVIFYSILLLIASGWGISRDNIGQDKFVISFVAIGLALALIASYFLQRYFSLLIMICYVIIIVTIFKNTNRNMFLIQAQSQDEENDGGQGHQRRNTTAEKFKMFKTFKAIMLAYLAAIMAILLIMVLFLENFPWIYNMLNEVLQLVMFVCIGWTFRLRDINIYYRIPDQDEDPSYYERPSTPIESFDGRSVELPEIPPAGSGAAPAAAAAASS